jgi:hypothetical protein
MSTYDAEALNAETEQQKQKGEGAFLSQEERQQIRRILKFPEEFPREFGAWIQEYIAVNGSLSRSQVEGLNRYAFSRGATLPEDPSDAQFFSLELGSGIVWNFRYNLQSASTYKWEFVGGPPVYHQVAAAASTTSPITGGPTLTLPLAGEYLVTASCHCDTTVATNGRPVMSIYANGSLVSEAYTDLAQNENDELIRTRLVTLAGAGQVIEMRYRSGGGTGGQVHTFSDRFLYITPVRVV